MGFDSPSHWLIVALVVLVLFGYKKLPEMSRSVGRSLRIFKTEMKGMSEDDSARQAEAQPAATAPPAAAPPAVPPAPVVAGTQPPPVVAQPDEQADQATKPATEAPWESQWDAPK
ncbi:MAG TPA: Sec-independent protein translocase subunit TatA [Jatrophihabitans sp.]|nr:Sec-independent protein translocase subunit TatA [Jatrophihabitans sp.]